MARYKPGVYKVQNLGLKIQLNVPQVIMPVFDFIDNQSVGHAIREAMRSAGRPAVTALKQILKQELIKSDQSTGATERSVGMKYGRSKTNPSRFYVLVGISTNHSEIHTSLVPEGQTTKLRRGRDQRGAGLFGLQTRRNKKGVFRSKQVFSRYRNAKRIAKKAGRPFRRIPRKYFHLIDRGFNHKQLGRFIEGYKFLDKLQRSLGNTMQLTFESRLKELVIPTIQKEMIRKMKSVLR